MPGDTEVIYDFETLGQSPESSPVLGMALLNYSEARFLVGDGYSYQELLDKVKFIKFDVEDQVKNYGCKIERDTLDWWTKQNPDAKKILKPSPEDKPIADLYGFMVVNTNIHNLKKVYTRGNTFDPIFLTHLMRKTGNPEPYKWWLIRDTRSMIDGMLIGSDTDNKFIPAEYKDVFVAHDPSHDIVMDVVRMQSLFRAILL